MKTKSILLFAVMVVVTLFGTNEAMAQECTLVQISGSNIVPTNYKIAFVGVTPCTNCGGTGKDGFLWDYRLINSPGSITQLDILTPVCSTGLDVFTIGGGQIINPGLGDPTTMFGVGDFQEKIARLALNSSPDFYLGVTKEAGQGATSMQIRVSKNLYYCPSIPGPECGLPSYIPQATRTSSMMLGTAEICFDFTNGCVSKIYDCKDPTHVYPQEPIPPEMTVDCGDIFGFSNPNCRTCIFTSQASPTCSNVTVGGTTTKIPTGCCSCRTIGTRTYCSIPCQAGQTCDQTTSMCF